MEVTNIGGPDFLTSAAKIITSEGLDGKPFHLLVGKLQREVSNLQIPDDLFFYNLFFYAVGILVWYCLPYRWLVLISSFFGSGFICQLFVIRCFVCCALGI